MSLATTSSVLNKWKDDEQEKSTQDLILDSVSQEEFLTVKQIYRRYKMRAENPVARPTLYNHLNDLLESGDVERENEPGVDRYRRADKPIKETRQDYSNPSSEGLPSFIERRIQAEVEKRVKQEIERLEGQVQQRILIENNQEQTGLEEDVSEKDQTEKTLKILQEAEEELKSSQVRERFKNQYREDPSQRTVRRYLKNLSDRGLIQIEGEKRGRTYKA